ncbi:MAG: glutathione S-transferase family protein, partial [Acetobacteraceae bacterium]|nr:glutathione S-transferase family protein [Acetobacteraceae bacterium]
ELVFYTNPMSRGRIVRWLLEEIGAPYRTEILDYGGKIKGPEFLALNPMAKVPAIRHGETVVTETAAICAYLADAFPDRELAPPPGDRNRGPYFRWLFFTAGPLEAALTDRALGWTVPENREGMAGYGSYARVLDALEHAVSAGPYLAGDRFSAADLYVGSQIGWGMMFGTIDKRPAFEQYWQGLRDRPAAVRAREIDDALIPAQPKPA